MKVLCVGSCTIDSMMKVDGEIKLPFKGSSSFKSSKLEEHWGGCAPNIAKGLSQLGVKTSLFCAPPKDDRYLKYLKTLNINLIFRGNAQDFKFYAILDNNGHRITIFNGDTGGSIPPTPEVLRKHDIIIISPTDKNTMLKTAELCKALKKPYILDIGNTVKIMTKAEYIKIHKNAFISSMNQNELNFIEKNFKIPLSALSGKNRQTIITRGTDGADWYFGKNFVHTDIIYAEPIDETGCGDAFRAGLVYGLIKGMDKKNSMKAGIWMAYKNVQLYGSQTYTVSENELLKGIIEEPNV